MFESWKQSIFIVLYPITLAGYKHFLFSFEEMPMKSIFFSAAKHQTTFCEFWLKYTESAINTKVGLY
jgi:hypothetical protein